MKQVVAALAVFAVLVVGAVFLMRGEDETAPADPATAVGEAGESAATDVAEESARDAETGDAADREAGDVANGGEDVADESFGTAAGDNGAAGDATVEPSFDIVRVEPGGDAVMAGVAEPGAEVTVVTRDGAIARTDADARGEWVVILEKPLEPGDHEIWIEAGSGGGETVESVQAVIVSIPEEGEILEDDTVETIPVAEVGTGEPGETAGLGEASGSDATHWRTAPADAGASDSMEVAAAVEPGSDPALAMGTSAEAGGAEAAVEPAKDDGVLAVVVPRDGEDDPAVMQAPGDGVGISGGGDLTLESLTYDGKGGVSLSGRAAPGAVAILYVDGSPVGEAVADEEGRWGITLENPLEAGRRRLRIDQLDDSGAVVARLETPFEHAVFAMPTADEPLIVIQPGNNLWLIARRIYGRGVLYTQIFEANRGQIADPHLIYPGQIFVVPEAGSSEG